MSKYYKTLKSLQAAYKSGELSRKHKLMLDNDDTFVWGPGDEGRCFDGGNPEDLLREALTLLGIPHEGV
jgi:hypothetical protein